MNGWGVEDPHHPGPLLPASPPPDGRRGSGLSRKRRKRGPPCLCYTPPAFRLRRAAQFSSRGGPSLESKVSQETFAEEIVLKIHEYQAKEILRRYGVATPRG